VGRTYWGGALFWFEVDLLVREETGNAKSVRDVLRGVAAAGTNVCVDLPVERMLALGDSGTGTRVLSRVYQRRALTSAAPELAEWWKKLGIGLRDGRAVFDDSAPWAETRRRMTRD
jgi:predicted metalloprotease with PDZ domain